MLDVTYGETHSCVDIPIFWIKNIEQGLVMKTEVSK